MATIDERLKWTVKQCVDGLWVLEDRDGLPAETCRNGDWCTITFKSEKAATSYLRRAAKAMASHSEWNIIWSHAIMNVPRRQGVRKGKYWVKADGPTPVPEYIKGVAKKRTQLVNGVVYHLHVSKTNYQYGQTACLARLMGMFVTNKKTGRKTPHGLGVLTAMQRGSKPRDPLKARLLKRLADAESGPALAMKMITDLGYGHRYTVMAKR